MQAVEESSCLGDRCVSIQTISNELCIQNLYGDFSVTRKLKNSVLKQNEERERERVTETEYIEVETTLVYQCCVPHLKFYLKTGLKLEDIVVKK